METTNNNSEKVKWYHYIAAFFAGFFLLNTIPHLVSGISGDPFPSPFANPPGKGLSSPIINTLWGCFNLVVGYLLFRASKISSKSKLLLLVFFIAILIASIMLSINFTEKAKL